MKTIVIDRATWRRGCRKMHEDICGLTELLNQHYFRCCLGFHCGQVCGLADDIISTMAQPLDIGCTIEGLTMLDENYQPISTPFAVTAMNINDREYITEKEREHLLKELAKLYGFNYKFVGRTPKKYWDYKFIRRKGK